MNQIPLTSEDYPVFVMPENDINQAVIDRFDYNRNMQKFNEVYFALIFSGSGQVDKASAF